MSTPQSLPPAGLDAEPLSWVMGGIRAALQASLEALNEAAIGGAGGDAVNADALQRAGAHLHQVHGALQMLELDGVTLITAAVERLLARAGTASTRLDADGLQRIARAYEALQEYLDEIQGGAAQQPARLYPWYRSLMELLGAERISAADLFFPDLKILPQLGAAHPAGLATDYLALRLRFEKALLHFLTTADPLDAASLCRVIDEVEQRQKKRQWRAFWWVMHGFADAVATGQIEQDRFTKQLFGRINFELRRLTEGGFGGNDGMLKDALFSLARIAAPGVLQLKIRAAYQLDGKLPEDFETGHYGQIDAAAERSAHEQTALAKACWSRVVQGKLDELSVFERHLAMLAEACSRLHSTPLSRLVDALSHIAGHAVQGNRDASLSLEIATGLLVLESGLTDIRHLPPHFSERAEAMIDRLRALDCGAPAIASPVGGIEDSFSQAQSGAVAALVIEMQAGLREVESLLEAFFRNKSSADALLRLAPLLHQIEGGLAILEQEAAVQALQHAQALVATVINNASAPDQAVFETLTHNVGALGLFMEALQRNPIDARNHFDFDVAGSRFHVLELQPAAREVEAQEVDADCNDADRDDAIGDTANGHREAAALVGVSEDDDGAELRGIFLEEAQEIVAIISQTLRSAQPGFDDADQLALLRRCFHTLKGSARMIALNQFGGSAHRIEQLLDLHLSGSGQTDGRLYALLWRVHAEFAAWVAELASGGGSARRADEFWRVVSAAQQQENASVERPNVSARDDVAEAIGDSAAPATNELPTATAAGADTAKPRSADVDVKQIGALQMSLPLYAIFRAETQDLLRILSNDLHDWRAQPDRYVSIPAVHAVHSLGGSSATVGLPAVHEIAYAMEAVMQHQLRNPVPLTDHEFDLLQQTVASAGAMLDEVERGHMPEPDTVTAQLLRRLLDTIDRRADAWLAQPSIAPEPVAALQSHAARERAAATLPPHEAPVPAAVSHDAPDPDLLAIFIEEARDIMPLFGQTLRDWRRAPDDVALGQALLRMTHTLKGSARMAGAMRLGQHMHGLESQIEAVMAGQSAAPPDFDELLMQHDRAQGLYEQLLTLSGGSLGNANRDGSEAAESAAAAEAGPTGSSAAPGGGVATAAPLVRVRADILDRLVNQAGEVAISRAKLETEVGSLHLLLADLNDNVTRLRVQLRELAMQAESQISAQISAQASDAVEREFDALEFDRFTRLQELTRMLAESVDDVSTVQQALHSSLASASTGLAVQGRLTRGLQQDLMRVRMVPFGSLSDRLYRVARQTAKEVGKRVSLDLRGSSLEVDRSVLDRMVGPFEHLLRNSIVHGIENAAMRLAAGKNETGELLVGIRHEGNEVVLQFADDGAGLDMPAVRERAVSSGLLDAAAQPTDAELIEMIFGSGFSTAASLTQTAGRGVGMDAVRSEVARLGGTVAVASEKGRGMQVTIRLPLTLAITQVVLVNASGRTYALPSVSVEQVVQLKPETFAEAFGRGAVEWQSQQVNLRYLTHLLGDRHAIPRSQPYAPVVILRHAAQRMAIHVDHLIGNREVVVKNVGAQLAGVAGISGATVLGSGEIVLILNPLQLAHRLQQSESAPRAQGLPAVALPLRPAIVMVVDDSLTVRRVTQRLLVREGYQVVLAKDGVDALEQLQSVLPDLMLVDIEMPRMDGFDLTRNVRDDARTKGIPIFMITSRTAAKHRNVALSLGVDKYLGKPYQEAELLRAIDRAVKDRVPARVE